MPRGLKEKQLDSKTRMHFDYLNPVFAEEHYGKYFIVKNGNGDDLSPHNRFYLCNKSRLEFMKTYCQEAVMVSHSKQQVALTELITLYPEQEIFVKRILNLFLGDKPSRKYAIKVATGFGLMLEIFNNRGIELKSIDEFTGKHIKALRKGADEGGYSKDRLIALTSFLLLVNERFSLKLSVGNFRKYAKQRCEHPTELSLAVTWQLDIYAQREIKENINRFKEYKKWMKELNEINDFFCIDNLAHSYFANIEQFGHQKASTRNRPFKNIAQVLHGIELQCWKERKNGKPVYACEADLEREKDLRKKAKNGVNITINDERMFAMWHQTVAPNYPYESDFLPKYKEVFGTTLFYWRNRIAKKNGFILSEFLSRIAPGPGEIYPLYLLALCRSGLNQDPIKDWRVWKDETEQYHVGVESGMGRIVDGFKGRGNSVQSTPLDRDMRRYVDSYIEYLSSVYDHSGDDHFFQYLDLRKNMNTGMFQRVTVNTLKGQRMSTRKNMFYRKYPIMDLEVLASGETVEKRLSWIDHNQIRKVKNLSEYLEGKQQWERQYLRGQKDPETEYIYQQTVQFQDAKKHRIAKSLESFVDFIKGKISIEENPRLKVFNGPISDCKNPFDPTYPGAKKLHSNDVCSNWRKCLTECEQCDVIAPIHGPVIVAWRDCMDDMRSIYELNESWEDEFIWDYMAAEATLSTFSKDVLRECEEKAPKYAEFVKREVLNSQRARKLTEEERGAE